MEMNFCRYELCCNYEIWYKRKKGIVTKHTVDNSERLTMYLVFKAITLAFAAYLLSNGNNFCSGCFSEGPNCTRTLRMCRKFEFSCN